MRFFQAYKRLDNLCRDTNGVGINGYIEDMKNRPNGEYKVTGWKDDYFQLKHYRYLRNRIAHENNAEEVDLCTEKDAAWLDAFYQRILTQTDPLALYFQATKPKAKPIPKPTAPPKPPAEMQKPRPAKPHTSTGMKLAVWSVLAAAAVIFLVLLTLRVL